MNKNNSSSEIDVNGLIFGKEINLIFYKRMFSCSLTKNEFLWVKYGDINSKNLRTIKDSDSNRPERINLPN